MNVSRRNDEGVKYEKIVLFYGSDGCGFVYRSAYVGLRG